jgi:hypothetical protein
LGLSPLAGLQLFTLQIYNTETIYLYLLLTALVIMSGGSVYKDHTFNNETAYTSHENSAIHRIVFWFLSVAVTVTVPELQLLN